MDSTNQKLDMGCPRLNPFLTKSHTHARGEFYEIYVHYANDLT